MKKKLTPYNIVLNDNDNSAEINMYGEVVTNRPKDFWTDEEDEGLYIVLQEFLNDLDNLKSRDHVTVRINSIGGELYAGLAIYNRLRELKDVTTIVDGIAASAASVILQAGSTRKVYSSSQVMIHSAAVFLFGYYNKTAIDEVEKDLIACNESIVNIYAEKSGQNKTKIRHMVEDTSWMVGEDVVEEGFADEVIEGETKIVASADCQKIYSNGIPMIARHVAKLPEHIEVMKQTPKGDANKNKEVMNMTAEEIKAQYPDIVAEIENAARQSVDTAAAEQSATEAERARIREIESIEASIADKELVNRAKYEEPMDAKELAFMAMQKQAAAGNVFLGNMKNDAEASGTDDVEPEAAPEDKPEDNKEKDAEDIKAVINAVQNGGAK